MTMLIAEDRRLPGKFKAEYKGQMELYLRWLEKHEMQEGEEQPIGLILCAMLRQMSQTQDRKPWAI